MAINNVCLYWLLKYRMPPETLNELKHDLLGYHSCKKFVHGDLAAI